MPLYFESEGPPKKLSDKIDELTTRCEDRVQIGKIIIAELIDLEKKAEDNVLHPLRDTLARYSPYMRYLAYSSDIGESFRRVIHARFVQASYAIAIGYVASDVALNGYYEHHRGSPPALVAKTVAHSGLFQIAASLAVPFLAIHTSVKLSKEHIFVPLTKTESWKQKYGKSSGKMLRRWGPSAIGLSLIPFLPLVDEPIEKTVDWIFGGHIAPHKRDKGGGWAGYLDACYPSWWRD